MGAHSISMNSVSYLIYLTNQNNPDECHLQMQPIRRDETEQHIVKTLWRHAGNKLFSSDFWPLSFFLTTKIPSVMPSGGAHVSSLGRWSTNRHQNCSSSPPAQVMTVSHAEAPYISACLFLLRPSFISSSSLRALQFFAAVSSPPLSHQLILEARWLTILPQMKHGHLKRPKPSRQTERDGGGRTQGKGDKWLRTGQRRSGGRRGLVEGEEDEDLWRSLAHETSVHWDHFALNFLRWLPSYQRCCMHPLLLCKSCMQSWVMVSNNHR